MVSICIILEGSGRNLWMAEASEHVAVPLKIACHPESLQSLQKLIITMYQKNRSLSVCWKPLFIAISNAAYSLEYVCFTPELAAYLQKCTEISRCIDLIHVCPLLCVMS